MINLTRLNTKLFLKVRKEKQSGALQPFEVNKESKDVSARYLNWCKHRTQIIC